MVYINRGRDVLQLIEKKGERGIREALVKIAEDNTILHQEIIELRKVTANCIELLNMFQAVLGGQQQSISQIVSRFEPNNEAANPNKSWSDS